MGWSRFWRRSRWDDERARELESYLAIETDDNIARGMAPEDARLAARRKLGNVTRTREVMYEMNTITLLESIWQDLRYGLRVLRGNPAFAIIAILSLALGTGANTAIFQLVNAIRLRTLPVANPQELVQIRVAEAPRGRTGTFNGRLITMTYPLFEQLQARQQAFAGVLAWGTDTHDLASGGLMRPVQTLWVSGSFFPTLGTQPALGRLLTTADDRRGCAPVAVLNHAFWQREFGGNPNVLGRTVPLSGHAFEILGVAPAGFFGLDVGRTFDVAIPLCADAIMRAADPYLDRRDAWFLATMGRLKPGWTVEAADAHLRSISPDMLAATISPRYSADNVSSYKLIKFGALAAGNGISSVRRSYEAPLWILLGVTGLVLLIACANLANLMLARATARAREVAVRLAIGASRGRIIRQMLSESLLLAAAGTIGGVLLAQWLSRFLVTFLNSETNPILVDLSFDWRTFAFTAALAGAACLLFGLAPAIRATGTAPGAAMKAGSRSTTDGQRRFGLRQTLVILQVALSLVLVVSALLFVRSLRNLLTQDPGFRKEGVVLASLGLARAGIPHDALNPTADAIMARLRREPGLDATVDASNVPAGDGNYWNDRIVIDGKTQEHETNLTRVGPGYFKAMDIAVIAGRDVDPRDTRSAPDVAVVNEAFVQTFFPHDDPIGRTFQIDPIPGEAAPLRQIIGVVKNSKYADLHDTFEPIIFLASAQNSAARTDLNLIVRSQLPTNTVMAAITRDVSEINPAISLTFGTMRAQIDRSLQRDRLMALVSGFFGALAALIATIGLYGVMSYIVARRRTEIGIRMALGAEPRAVIRLITREAGTLVAIGLIVGGGLAVVATRSAQTMLFELQPSDPTTLGLAMVGLGAVAAVAAWLPARRAARLDPTSALRQD
jgi:putative ABC transport system permease protein